MSRVNQSASSLRNAERPVVDRAGRDRDGGHGEQIGEVGVATEPCVDAPGVGCDLGKGGVFRRCRQQQNISIAKGVHRLLPQRVDPEPVGGQLMSRQVRGCAHDGAYRGFH
jgi:hypothetical protein